MASTSGLLSRLTKSEHDTIVTNNEFVTTSMRLFRHCSVSCIVGGGMYLSEAGVARSGVCGHEFRTWSTATRHGLFATRYLINAGCVNESLHALIRLRCTLSRLECEEESTPCKLRKPPVYGGSLRQPMWLVLDHLKKLTASNLGMTYILLLICIRKHLVINGSYYDVKLGEIGRLDVAPCCHACEYVTCLVVAASSHPLHHQHQYPQSNL